MAVDDDFYEMQCGDRHPGHADVRCKIGWDVEHTEHTSGQYSWSHGPPPSARLDWMSPDDLRTAAVAVRCCVIAGERLAAKLDSLAAQGGAVGADRPDLEAAVEAAVKEVIGGNSKGGSHQ